MLQSTINAVDGTRDSVGFCILFLLGSLLQSLERLENILRELVESLQRHIGLAVLNSRNLTLHRGLTSSRLHISSETQLSEIHFSKYLISCTLHLLLQLLKLSELLLVEVLHIHKKVRYYLEYDENMQMYLVLDSVLTLLEASGSICNMAARGAKAHRASNTGKAGTDCAEHFQSEKQRTEYTHLFFEVLFP